MFIKDGFKSCIKYFTIEMRELFERPWSKFASLILSENWGNASIHTVFDGSLLLHADEKKNCELICVNFYGYLLV